MKKTRLPGPPHSGRTAKTLWDDPGFPFLHTGLLMAADRFIIIKLSCGFDNSEKAENVSKKQMKS
ncbi:hypothetical protein [Faecalibacterium wellingii]|uniref:Uncharacterized protein n=1 Tax=Faecalibacterium wellingii TaxID=2929491 RepID=A0ABU3TZ42_9FIRM|nr:hypothetical protein [Faecalibacterium prausnitzii]